MGDGLPKIQNTEIKQAILKAVEDALDKQGDVFQGSQAYYGFTARVEVSLHLIARGKDHVRTIAVVGGGEIPKEEKGDKLPPPEESSKITSAEVSKGQQEIAKTGE